ncbi:FAD binding domain-containing protein [Streptomyces sp. NPDC004227]
MNYARPGSVAELLKIRAERPDWTLVAGGTDVMVPINFGRSRPPGLIDLAHVPELALRSREGGTLTIGATVTFGALERGGPLNGGTPPALVIAARSVGSPQIRAAATIGGNLGTSSPAGDAHPALVACRAEIVAGSARGTRVIAVDDFFLRPGRSALARDEVVLAVRVPVPEHTTQQFAKAGVRNAMVISVASVAVAIDWTGRRVGVGLGSVGPTPLRAAEAERHLERLLWPEPREVYPATAPDLTGFAELTAGAATPIDDVRGTAAYRRHVIRVMAARCARRAINEAINEGRSGETHRQR